MYNRMPPNNHSSTAKDVFSYLLMIIMLYIGVITYIAMIWQYINVGFPDALNQSYNAYGIVRNSISCLVVVWPVLILMTWMIGKDLRLHKEKQEMWVRKWLTYLTLFIASMTIIIDLIFLLNFFLNGEITVRFILKVLAILAVAGAVFSYYLWDLKRDTSVKSKTTLLVAMITSIVILVSIIGGFFIIGSPMHQRNVRLDNQRVSDLQNIQYEIINYWTQKGMIPKTIADLQDPISGFIAPIDPLANTPYTYNVKGDRTFELCATFAEASSNEANLGSTRPVVYSEKSGVSDVWTHNAGTVCFERSIDPELYKPNTAKSPLPTMIVE